MPTKMHMEPEPGDQTPEVGAATDVAPLGRDHAKPAHELTAEHRFDFGSEADALTQPR